MAYIQDRQVCVCGCKCISILGHWWGQPVHDWPVVLCQQNYEHLFKVNDKEVGGSFYLQSKVRFIVQFPVSRHLCASQWLLVPERLETMWLNKQLLPCIHGDSDHLLEVFIRCNGKLSLLGFIPLWCLYRALHRAVLMIAHILRPVVTIMIMPYIRTRGRPIMIFQLRYRLLEDQKKTIQINICNSDNYNNTEWTLILTWYNTSIKSIWPQINNETCSIWFK